MMIHRRRFLAGAAAAVTIVGDAPAVIAQPKVQWRMSTTWPPQLDNLQGTAQRLGQLVEEMSGGRFRIEVFPGGQIMPPFECFDATSKGTIEAYMGAASYWTGKDPAAEWFISIPFGMDPQGMAVWCYQGDGLKLWEETYAPFNVLPRLGPGFAPQMGGWFKRKITTIADYTGLKMRIAGLGSKLKGKVELVQFPAPVLRDLRKLAAAVIREQSEKSPMARKVHASFVKFQALLGGWEHVAEGAYHQLLKG